MGLFDKLFNKSEPPRSASPTPRPAPTPSDGLPPQIAVKGLKDLAAIEFTAYAQMNLPVHLWGHFDKAQCLSSEFTLTSSTVAPPTLSQIRALFDELHAYFGTDGLGQNAFGPNDAFDWGAAPLRRVNRCFYFFGENLASVRATNPSSFAASDFGSKPSIVVQINRDVTDPELDCSIQITHWDKLKERYLG